MGNRQSASQTPSPSIDLDISSQALVSIGQLAVDHRTHRRGHRRRKSNSMSKGLHSDWAAFSSAGDGLSDAVNTQDDKQMTSDDILFIRYAFNNHPIFNSIDQDTMYMHCNYQANGHRVGSIWNVLRR